MADETPTVPTGSQPPSSHFVEERTIGKDGKPQPQVTRSVEGCVVDFAKQIQVNPATGQTFNFDGELIDG